MYATMTAGAIHTQSPKENRIIEALFKSVIIASTSIDGKYDNAYHRGGNFEILLTSHCSSISNTEMMIAPMRRLYVVTPPE